MGEFVSDELLRRFTLVFVSGLTSPIAAAVALGLTDTEFAAIISRARPATDWERDAIGQLLSDYKLALTDVNARWKARGLRQRPR